MRVIKEKTQKRKSLSFLNFAASYSESPETGPFPNEEFS